VTSIARLRAIVRDADAAYRAGTPLMSDAEFDSWLAELRNRAPHAPELQVPGGGTALLSLHACADLDELTDWYASLPSPVVVAQPKIDGCALALRYEGGRLAAAWTRSGACALPLARLVASIPETIHCAGVLEVHGELWADDRKQSSAAAALRRKQPSGAGLNFSAYRQPTATTLETITLSTLSNLGFSVPPTLLCSSLQQAWNVFDAWIAGSEFSDYPCDGIVLKAASHAHQAALGASTRCPHWAVSLKP
jgi:DNA ligase (NAD+)